MKRCRLPNDLEIFHMNVAETRYLYDEVFKGRVYLKHGIHLDTGACMFDVGANIGLSALFFHRQCRDVRLFAFEPAPRTFQVLSANMRLHHVNAKLFQCALSNRSGIQRLTFYSNNTVMSGLYGNAAEDLRVSRTAVINSGLMPKDADAVLAGTFKPKVLTCRVRTLSEILNEQNVERIDLLKIDAEKSELDVLAGIREADWGRIRQIVVEVHDLDGRLDHVRDILERHGYELDVWQDPLLEGTSIRLIFARRASVGAGLRRRSSPRPPGLARARRAR